ncbi:MULTISPECIES: C40 family peptidase [unclassified Paenibacillus]|uniref:C40 family peptidase n=1 Tax=Paenibacillus provencensis TaxID=441151 RepID=A0ABW3PQ17_9BACL|nr:MULTISPECIES: C40 family peptidase [unclassified Paenibacillus]MCM3128954.1 C40 family peptidase [Paenibacillus sp. MER 78]SFS50546.1 NlpC/P60 family protein [Paenibacillus sp. 453mf]
MKKTLTAAALGFALLFSAGVTEASASILSKTVNNTVGIPYQYGGSTLSGFDCSGFTRYVYKQLGVNLPHSSKQQFHKGQAIKKSELVKGDLVFFNTSGSGVSHVGIYLGNNQFVSATSSKGIAITPINKGYWSSKYYGAKRMLSPASAKRAGL